MSNTIKRVKEHYNEALEYFPEDKIIGIFFTRLTKLSARYGVFRR